MVYWGVKEEEEEYSRAVFMQDGATPHTAKSTRELLNTNFKDRVIGKHFSLSWPPYSPDLTPADFMLWPQIKKKIYSENRHIYKSIPALKRAITYQFKQFGASRNYENLSEQVRSRWSQYLAAKGSRF